MVRAAGLAAAALGLGLALQGCGSSSGSGTTTAKPSEATTTTILTTTTQLSPIGPQKPQDFVPVRGVVYDPRPFKTLPGAPPGRDMAQLAAEPAYHTARDDLGLIRSMGGSTVRVWAAMGSETESDHGRFLDRCSELGLNVILDYFAPPLCAVGEKTAFDCSEKMKYFTQNALLKQGFMKNGTWHPAVKMVMLMERPDGLGVSSDSGGPPDCPKDDTDQPAAWCRVKVVLSLLDGFLQGEKAAGVDGKDVYVGVAWDWTSRRSIDGKVNGELFGFQDMVAGIAKPQLAQYSFISEDYKEVFKTRWVHAINTAQTQWKMINEKVNMKYEPYKSNKLLLSEVTPDDTGAEPQDLTGDLRAIDEEAKKNDWFLGAVLEGFQTDYEDSQNIRVRMFGLGDEKLAPDMNICNMDARTGVKICGMYSVWCLDAQGQNSKHSGEVAAAWGGHVGPAVGLCRGSAGAEDAVDFVM